MLAPSEAEGHSDKQQVRGTRHDFWLWWLFRQLQWVDTADPPSVASQALASVSIFLTILFVMEVILKCISLSPIGYWHSRRNRYDLCVTLMGVIWVAIHLSEHVGAHNQSCLVVSCVRERQCSERHWSKHFALTHITLNV